MSEKKHIEPEVLPVKRGPGRPPRALEIVGDKPLPERVSQITAYHEAAMTAAAQTAMYAILCGMELIAARAQVPYGEWDAWVDANCPFNRASAWRYMQAAQNKTKEIPNLCARRGLLETPPHLLAPADRRVLVESVKDAVDGQTWTELQMELGLRTPAKDRGGAREGAGRPRTSDFSEERKALIRQQYKRMIDQMSQAILSTKSWQYLDPIDLAAIDESLLTFREALKPALTAALGR